MKEGCFLFLFLVSMLCSNSSMAQYPSDLSKEKAFPRIPGCEQIKGVEQESCNHKMLIQYIKKHLTYPVSAIREGVEGVVIVSVKINENGDLKESKVLRSLFPPCDKEAIRIVQSIPEWLPAERGEKTIEAIRNIVVHFNLEDHYKKHPEHRPVFLPQTMDKKPRKKKRTKQKRKIKAH